MESIEGGDDEVGLKDMQEPEGIIEDTADGELAQSLGDVYLKSSIVEKTPIAKPRNPPQDIQLEDDTALD